MRVVDEADANGDDHIGDHLVNQAVESHRRVCGSFGISAASNSGFKSVFNVFLLKKEIPSGFPVEHRSGVRTSYTFFG